MSEAEPDSVAIWRRDLAAVATKGELFRQVEVFAAVGSTMDLAREMPPGTFVTCLEQTAGRGRQGRVWFDGGGGVAATAILCADAIDLEDPLLSARAGVAMLAAVEPWLGVGPELKWPNDLMVGDRKLGGVLVERVGERIHVGVGINVLPVRRPPAVEAVAVSIAELVPSSPSRLAVVRTLLPAVETWMTCPATRVRSVWCERDWLRGRLVRLRDGSAERIGRIESIEPGSYLDLVDRSGSIRRVAAATAQILEVLAGPDLADRVGGIEPNRR